MKNLVKYLKESVATGGAKIPSDNFEDIIDALSIVLGEEPNMDSPLYDKISILTKYQSTVNLTQRSSLVFNLEKFKTAKEEKKKYIFISGYDANLLYNLFDYIIGVVKTSQVRKRFEELKQCVLK